MPNFAPTNEQEAAVNASQTGQNVVIEAGAGSGKTSTLKLIGEAHPAKAIAYVSFNSAIAKEAESKMPMNVDSRTAHSFAYRAIVGRASSKFGKRLGGKKPSSRDVAALLNENKALTYSVIEAGTEHQRVIKPSAIGYAATKTVERFCQSAETELQTWMVPHMEGLDKAAQAAFAAHVLPLANRVWADVQNENGHMFKFDHCHYLKMYQLSGSPLMVEIGGTWTMGKYGKYRKGGTVRKAQIILYDEAQDANPVTQAIVENMVRNHGAQVIVVGDRAQAIYGFTGARNAMDKFAAPHVLKLTKSFRFGHEIAALANQLLALMPDTDMQIVGHDPVPSTVQG